MALPVLALPLGDRLALRPQPATGLGCVCRLPRTHRKRRPTCPTACLATPLSATWPVWWVSPCRQYPRPFSENRPKQMANSQTMPTNMPWIKVSATCLVVGLLLVGDVLLCSQRNTHRDGKLQNHLFSAPGKCHRTA